MERSHPENPQTFQNFVSLNANVDAKQTALEFSNKQDSKDHVLLITGNIGVGKTHLARACMNQIKAQNPDKAILYLSFENVLGRLHKNEQGIQDLDYLDGCSVILIDSYFIKTKEEKRIEFLSRRDQFWRLISQTKAKVIITSTDEAIPVPCKRIELIHETDKESVRRIMEMKLAEAGFQFSDEVIEFISTLNISSTRLIESFIISLLYRSVIDKKEIDLPFARSVFQHLFRK